MSNNKRLVNNGINGQSKEWWDEITDGWIQQDPETQRNEREQWMGEIESGKMVEWGQPVETHYKNTYFLHSSWQKCLLSHMKRLFPPSPITVMFVVTQEMHTWAVRPKQHCTRGGEGGDFVSFRWKGCMVRNWKIQFCWVAAPWLPCSCTWEGEGRDGWKDEWIGQMGGMLVPCPVKLISLRI